MVHVLLTGASGQVGWEVARRSHGTRLSITATSRRELDVTNRRAVTECFWAVRPRVVINAAAYTAVDRAEMEPAAAYAVNRDGARHLAEASDRVGATLIHVSTDYVFDGHKDGPYREDDPAIPLGVYGSSKLSGEKAVRRIVAQHLILRTSWVYSRHGRNFVTTMLGLGEQNERLQVVNDQRGCPTYAGDLADVILALSRRCVEGDLSSDGYGTFHCAGEGSTTWYGLAVRLFNEVSAWRGRSPVVEPITTADYPTTAKRPLNSVLDCGRLHQIHGLKLRPWADALAEMLAMPETALPQ